MRKLLAYFRKSKASTHKLVFLFERDGHKYYNFPKEVNLPLERFAQTLALQEKISAGLSGEEMNKILVEMESSIAQGLSNPANAVRVAGFIAVIRERQDTVVHRTNLLNIAATWVVRDDENPYTINHDIHREKLNTFEIMAQEGPHDFFTVADIPPLFPLLTMSPENFALLWDHNQQSMNHLLNTLNRVISHPL